MKQSPSLGVTQHQPNLSTPKIMWCVTLALMPAVFIMLGLYGLNFAINVIACILYSCALESLVCYWRSRPVMPYLSDGSAVITALLIALSLPPSAPLWLLGVACIFGIVFAKHLYGGLGNNPFNPAMIGFAVVIIAFPGEMSHWHIDMQHPLIVSLQDWLLQWQGIAWDGRSGATALEALNNARIQQYTLTPALQAIMPQALLLSLAYLVGGLWLWHKSIINWSTPSLFLATLVFISAIYHYHAPEHYASPASHLLNASTVMAAFFIITDPISGSSTPKGRLIFAVGVAVLSFIIRTWANLPDGVAFAVLLMNMLVPIIDSNTRPPYRGERL